MLHNGRKQEPGHEKVLVMLDPCWMLSSLVNNTRSEVTPQSEEAGELEREEDRKALFGAKL